MNRSILILGPPCSGKGTQSEFIKDMNIYHLSAGNLLRDKYPIGTEERKLLDSGTLIDVNIVNNLIGEKILEKNFNIMIDGYPRDNDQAIYLRNFYNKHNKRIDYIFVLNTSKDKLIERMNNRLFCTLCQRTFSIDKKCCLPLIKRDDDNLITFEKRYNIFNIYIDQILTILNNDMNIINIDGNKTILEVKDEIIKYIK